MTSDITAVKAAVDALLLDGPARLEEHYGHKRGNPASPATDESCAAGGDLWRDGRASYPPL
jgi:hypothetical protein